MLIDWFTVGAQILNFLVLVVLLKIFLYDRIVRAMDEREQTIQERLDTAEQKQHAADKERKEFQKERRQLEQQKSEELAKARDKAKEEREKLLQQARKEVQEERRKWEKSVHSDAETLIRSLRATAADQVFALASRVLQDVAGANLQEQLADGFIRRLKDAEPKEMEELRQAAIKNNNTVAVRSPTELSDSQRNAVESELHELLFKNVEVTYEQDPDMEPGVLVAAGSVSLDWSAAGRLDELEDYARKALSRMQSGGPAQPSGQEG